MAKRNTKSWKHNSKSPKQYGERKAIKQMTPFMVLDETLAEMWDTEMQYSNTDDGVEESEVE